MMPTPSDTPAPAHPEWVKPGARVVSSCHGPGHITSVHREMIGVHWDANERDKTTDCWYQDYDGSGQYSSGHGVDALTPEAHS